MESCDFPDLNFSTFCRFTVKDFNVFIEGAPVAVFWPMFKKPDLSDFGQYQLGDTAKKLLS